MLKHLFLLVLIIASFANNLNAQTNRAQVLLDSIMTMEVNPTNESWLVILNRLRVLSEIEKDSFLLGQSLFGISNTYLAGEDYLNYECALNEYFEYSKDTASIGLIHYSNALSSKANLSQIKGNSRKAIELTLESIEYEQIIGSRPKDMAMLYRNLSIFYRFIGDYNEAYRTAKLILDYTEKIEFEDEFKKGYNLADINLIIGLSFLSKSEFKSAAPYFQKSLILLGKYNLTESPAQKKLRIRVLLRLGACLLDNGELIKVKSILAKVEKVQNSIDFRKYQLNELKSEYMIVNNDYSGALELLYLALVDATKFNKETKLFAVTTRINSRIADVQTKLGLNEDALISCQNGLKYFDGELTDDLLTNPVIEDVSFASQAIETLLNKAKISASLNKETRDSHYFNIANNAYWEGLKLVDLMRNSYIDNESKFYVTGHATNLYDDYLSLLSNYSEDNITVRKSLEIMSRTKAINLTEEIKNKRSLSKSKIPKKNLDEIDNFKTNIIFYTKKISELGASDSADTISIVSSLQKELDKTKTSYSIILNRLQRLYPDYFSNQRDLSFHSDLELIQEKLGNDELLLDFYIGKEDLFILAISSDRARFKRVNYDFSDELMEYIKYTKDKPSKGRISVQKGKDLSLFLYERLFESIKDMLEDKNKLVIIPHNKLNSLSFDALMNIDDEPEYLIDKYSIRYLYSTQQLFEKSGSFVNGKAYLVNPHFYAESDSERNCSSEQLGALKYASEEVDHIEKLMKSIRLSGESASVSNFVTNVTNFPIIHLATHACLSETDPMLSQIFFSDGSLTNYDLQNLNISPELVVLAACNTAQGEIQKGEGVISLSRGFFEAGVKSLVSSLWSIDDYSSSEIIKGMYTHLKEGKSKAQSLRHAKLDYLESADKLRSHPYYWAGLVQIGDGSPITNTWNWSMIIGWTALLLVAFFFYLFKSRK